MNIEVNIEESSNITNLQVPDLKTSNEIDSTDTKNKFATVEQSGNKAKVNWSPNAEQQREISQSGVKGQFIVRYDVDRVSNPNQILVDEGYFVHFFAPEGLKTLPKHVLFALDISGSMSGRKIEQLRESLTLILSDIGQGDYFSLILFSDSVQLWTVDGTVGEASPSWNYYDEIKTTPQPEVEISKRFIVPATPENIAKAKAFAANLNETGGTNIIAALRKSLEIAQWAQKQNIKEAKPLIIFLTDGQPNVEMSDTEEIVKTVKKLNVDKFPLFSLAFGTGADLDFLRKLSLSNSGFARNIYVASDTHLQLNNFYKQVASPILANVSFDYIPGQVNENTLTKSVFNNLFNGSELVVAGKLADGAKTLNGNLTGQKTEGFFCIQIDNPYIISDKFPPLEPVNRTKGHLEKLWAYLYIKELLDKDLISDEKNSTYKQKALNLSLEYSFVTPLTSLVVVKPNETSKAQPIITDAQGNEESLLQASPISLRGPSGSSSNFGSPYYQSVPAPAAKRKFVMNRISTDSGLSGFGYMPQSMSKGSNSPQPLSSYPLLSTPLVLSEPDLIIDSTALSQPHSSQNTVLFEEDSVDFSSNVYATELPAIDKVETLLNITDIVWLKNITDVKFPSSNNTYSIGQSDLPDTEFQSCLLPKSNNTLGHCRHLAHCVLPAIINSFEDFVPYGEQCVIDARFVGICCPQQYTATKSNSTTTETINSTTVTSGPTTLIPTTSTV